MTPTFRAVLDPNIVLSALVFPAGHLAPIRVAWQKEIFHPLISKETTEELIRAINYPKFKLSSADQDELLADYLPYCRIVKVPARAPKTSPVRDRFDVPFLQLAAFGKAKCLVTGDRDLLSIGGQLSFTIVTAADFITTLSLES